MAKNNIRSIRMDDRIVEIIEAQAGENFTQKFEKLVTRCMWELPEREKELQRINGLIRAKRERLNELQATVNRLANAITRLDKELGSLLDKK